MIASHLVLLIALSLIVVALALLIVVLAAVPVAMTVDSVALALGAGYHFLAPTPHSRWRTRPRRPQPRWTSTRTTPRS